MPGITVAGVGTPRVDDVTIYPDGVMIRCDSARSNAYWFEAQFTRSALVALLARVDAEAAESARAAALPDTDPDIELPL